MARRDKYSKLVWLRKLPGDTADGRTVSPGPVKMGFLSYVHTLTAGNELWIEMEFTNNAFRLRCYPLAGNHAEDAPKICISYAGKRLISLLACAVADYEAYMLKPEAALLAPLEHIRWVE